MNQKYLLLYISETNLMDNHEQKQNKIVLQNEF